MRKITGAETIRQELPDILHDESRFESGTPSEVCFPESLEDVKLLVDATRLQGKRVAFIGAQTGTTGGAVPEEAAVALCFSSMKRIIEVDMAHPDRPVLICEPGVTLDEIGRFLHNPARWHCSVPGSQGLLPGAFFYPPDPTEMTAQLGGTVATNASGARSYRYGATREHIASLEVILASGETVTLRRSGVQGAWDRRIITDQGTVLEIPSLPYTFGVLKNASGYYNTATMEAIDLFIGSEGTLGAITRVGIYLSPLPKLLSGLTFFPSKEHAFDFADFLRSEDNIAAIEFFDSGALRFIDHYRGRIPDKFPAFPENSGAAVLWEYVEMVEGSFEDQMDRWEHKLINCKSSFEATWSGFDEKETEKLHHFRHALPETVNSIIAENRRLCSSIRKIGTDSAFTSEVFRRSWDEMMTLIADNNIVHAAFGHLGNYHIHINLVPSTADELATSLVVYDKLMEIAVRENGTVSAEHGIGKIKKKYLRQMYGDAGVAAMKQIKDVLDPEGRLNPGTLLG